MIDRNINSYNLGLYGDYLMNTEPNSTGKPEESNETYSNGMIPDAAKTPAPLNPREKILAEKKIPALVISFIIPTIIGMMVNAIYNVVDRFWIGRMDGQALAMAGVGVTLSLTTIAFSFMVLIGIGSTALISLKLGERKHDEAEKVLGNCASLSFLSALIVMILGFIFVKPLLQLVGASEDTLPYAMDYLGVLLMFNVVNSVQFSMSSVMRGVGQPVWAVMTQATGAVINIILDPIFIFSAGPINLFGFTLHLPFGFGMGVKGAALATGIAQAVSFLICIFYYFSKKSPVHFHVRNLRPRYQIALRIAAIGISSFALQGAAAVVQALSTIQLTRYGGDLAISAVTIVNTIALFCIMPLIGINQGIQPIIGYNYGAKNYRRVRSAFFFAMLLASCMTVISAVLIQLFPEVFVRAFADDPEVIQLSSYALRCTLLIMPLLGFQIVSANYFQFVGKSVIALVMTLLRQIIFLIPLYLILPQIFGLDGIWFATPIADILAVIVTSVVISREIFKLSKQIRDQEGMALVHS